MNIIEAMRIVRDMDLNEDTLDTTNATLLYCQSRNQYGESFYNVGNAPRPLYTGYTGPGAKIPDMDMDGIPDNIDYHWGPGQW